MYKVEFKKVGRNHVSFTKSMKKLDYDSFYRAVRPYLVSSDIWFGVSNDETKGTVFAGFHSVGSFEIIE